MEHRGVSALAGVARKPVCLRVFLGRGHGAVCVGRAVSSMLSAAGSVVLCTFHCHGCGENQRAGEAGIGVWGKTWNRAVVLRGRGDRAGNAAHGARTRGRCAVRPLCGRCPVSGVCAWWPGLPGHHAGRICGARVPARPPGETAAGGPVICGLAGAGPSARRRAAAYAGLSGAVPGRVSSPVARRYGLITISNCREME